jgi:Na+/H+ antiporter NhaD/arsenite permease-like protein
LTTPPPSRGGDRLSLAGVVNLAWLAGVLLAILWIPGPWREIAIVAMTALSLVTTPSGLRRANGFTAGPILEVAAVFFGIFLTMVPALEMLRAHATNLGIQEPRQFFWATGVVSALLDNAPTYLAFLAVAQGLDMPQEVVGVTHATLRAISLGAVCLGANTYIGNAPNFMVRAIAERANVAMPSFFGYMVYSTATLVPLYAALSWLFL